MENIKHPVWCQAGSRHIKQIKISHRKASPQSWCFSHAKFLDLEPDRLEKYNKNKGDMQAATVRGRNSTCFDLVNTDQSS